MLTGDQFSSSLPLLDSQRNGREIRMSMIAFAHVIAMNCVHRKSSKMFEWPFPNTIACRYSMKYLQFKYSGIVTQLHAGIL